jgi:hypothetical protein
MRRPASSLLGRSSQRLLNALQQLVSAKWLPQKVDRASFHRLRAHRNVAVPSDKEQLFLAMLLEECFLEIHSV